MLQLDNIKISTNTLFNMSSASASYLAIIAQFPTSNGLLDQLRPRLQQLALNAAYLFYKHNYEPSPQQVQAIYNDVYAKYALMAITGNLSSVTFEYHQVSDIDFSSLVNMGIVTL